MKLLNYCLLLLIILLGMSFAILNAEPVTINYYIASQKMPLSLILVIALGFGLILGMLLSLKVYFRGKTKQRALMHRVKMAEKEVENLRAMPLRDDR